MKRILPLDTRARFDAKNHDAAYKIFHYIWPCEIPEHYFFSAEYLQIAGVPTTGDKAMDLELMKMPRLVNITIAAMVHFHDEGAPIRLTNPKDAITIYKLLREHMDAWRNILNSMMGVDAPPAEDFVMLNNFAEAVKPVAEAYNGGERPKTGLAALIATIQGKHGVLRQNAMKDRISSDGVDGIVNGIKRQTGRQTAASERMLRLLGSTTQ